MTKSKKVTAPAKKKKENAPSKGTLVQGTIIVNYVQTQVPFKHSKDVCDALANIILSDFHRSFCPTPSSDDDTD